MEKGFRDWLKGRGFDGKTISTQLSHVARIEKHFGDLDSAFEADGFERVRAALSYTKEDERKQRPNPAPFEIDGDLYSNLAGYRTTLNYYSDYRRSVEVDDPADENAKVLKAKPATKGGNGGSVSWTDERTDRLKELWTQGTRASQIADELGVSRNQVIGKAHRLGLQSRPSPVGPKGATIGLTPEDGLFVDPGELGKMRKAFLARFPDFEKRDFSASEGGYWEVERSYKQILIDNSARLFKTAERLKPEFVGAAILRILEVKPSNLLGWRELRRIEAVKAAHPLLLERALGELVLSKDPPPLSVSRCVAQIAEAYLEGQEGNRPYAHLRTIPTTVLALARPAEAIAVRYTAIHRAVLQLTGEAPFGNAPLTAQEYVRVLAVSRSVERTMREEWGWNPRDLWDVQGFFWVATGTDTTVEPPEDEPPEEPGQSVQDRYRTQADDPAMVDSLERGPFAAVLAARIVEIRRSERADEPEGDRAFMVHLHGPWGSGKSSILNLLRRDLEQPADGEASLVVMFNAWKQQRMRPPWWALMNAVYRAAVARCAASDNAATRRGERLRLWRTWWSWRLKAEWFPILLAALSLGLLILLLWASDTRGFAETAIKIGVTAAAALTGIFAYARLMIFGSQKAVQAYADLTTDPYRRIVKLFNRLVSKIGAPLVVFIDDLDRCDSDYVVELLEGIQTLFRHAPVIYVVAADRKWICSSFEKKYGDFAASIGEPGRPLGYLFLDKLFQISAEMPKLNREVQANYLAALLSEEAPGKEGPSPELIAEAEERVSGISNEEDLQQMIADEAAQVVPPAERKESLDRQRALRQAAALQITSARAAADTEHRLQKLSHLIEPNPRSMKRLVNAVGMAQARGILEGRPATPETRARWAMLSLRWPLLADFLADNPEAIAHWKSPPDGAGAGPPPDSGWPAAVRALHGDRAVIQVVGGEGDEGELTPDGLVALLG